MFAVRAFFTVCNALRKLSQDDVGPVGRWREALQTWAEPDDFAFVVVRRTVGAFDMPPTQYFRRFPTLSLGGWRRLQVHPLPRGDSTGPLSSGSDDKTSQSSAPFETELRPP